jgi:hypothetical protein
MRLVICAGLFANATANVFAQSEPLDYPQWRGRTRDGSASGFVEPKSSFAFGI